MTDTLREPSATSAETDRLAVDTLRFLAADMVQAAGSGHPGMPMGAAPMAWTLWSRHLRQDPAAPDWPDRDRFVLSAGHGSALLYGLLHLFGHDLPEAELRSFRKLGSRTPGHPEFGHTPGVECTTGPLGQGLAMAVGMALAERMAHARYPEVTGHRTYAVVGDGCLMEGVSHEAASLAGHLGLGRLVVLWDDNAITIDGGVARACGDDQLARFAAYGWHTEAVADGGDIEAVDEAVLRAKADPRPSFIAVRTVIGDGAPGVEGTAKAHGSPLGEEVLAEAKRRAGWDRPPFAVPEPVRRTCAALAADGAREHGSWRETFAAFEAAAPERAARFRRTHERLLPEGLGEILAGTAGDAPRATRQASQACLDALAPVLPELVGGSADLAGSTGTTYGDLVTRDDYAHRAIAFGVREFGMAAVLNGMSLHGGFRVFGSTFLVFADYLRPALRLSALMGQPVVYVFTHDSVAVGEDGPTHQPVGHIESLRLIPGLQVLRPADDRETAEAWRLALQRTDGPTALVLSRQAVPQLAPARQDEDGEAVSVSVEIVATGSEVALAEAVAEALRGEAYGVRVVSAMDRSRYTPDPSAVAVSIEAGSSAGWKGLVDLAVGIDEFGSSGPGDEVLAHHGFTVDAVLDRVRAHLNR
ncbi:transketolase [Streptomyces sp. Amel2xB2]|uniref:transketolase n=1 Tax=Streptomyces sp. Amel2xB2 TaxID=1305829 RepID=UPI000DB9EF3B|nr:transketolase [Streptomyces sp. Amel2xB2]RAJ68788.1 transketolase [Streptomyces sp. Amel2xB2]